MGSRDTGDYDCPHCRYKTLRWGASRCPECHGDTWNFWERLRASEIEEKKADKYEQSVRQWQWAWPVRVYFAYLLPVLAMVSPLALSGHIREGSLIDWFWILLPGVNWLSLLACLGVMKTKLTSQYQVSALSWGVAGVILLIINFLHESRKGA